MRFEGKVFRDGRFWLAEIPLLEAMTQGRTRAEALAMIGAWDRAERDLDCAAAIEPEDSFALYIRGLVHEARGRVEEAKKV